MNDKKKSVHNEPPVDEFQDHRALSNVRQQQIQEQRGQPTYTGLGIGRNANEEKELKKLKQSEYKRQLDSQYVDPRGKPQQQQSMRGIAAEEDNIPMLGAHHRNGSNNNNSNYGKNRLIVIFLSLFFHLFLMIFSILFLLISIRRRRTRLTTTTTEKSNNGRNTIT
jgi:hypothetical protein